jgi:ribonuclease P protein component
VPKAVLDSQFSFPRSSRLVSKQDFQFVFAKPDYKLSYRQFLLLSRIRQPASFASQPITETRLGLVISKRWLKHAVDRNRVKRIVRESFRQHKKILKELDIIVLIRSECSAVSKPQLRNDIDHLWPLLAKSALPCSSR